MSVLLIKSPKSSLVTAIGGAPRAPHGTKWPTCKTCGGPMQFLATLHLPEIAPEAGLAGTLLLFQCQNDPGLCYEWDANAGGNKAVLVEYSSASAMHVPEGPTTLSSTTGILLEPWIASDDDDLDSYLSAVASRPEIVGKAGGAPTWLQDAETPDCVCGRPMRFVAQIDSGASDEINFGDGGIGYSFVCSVCPSEAKFLWQCL